MRRITAIKKSEWHKLKNMDVQVKNGMVVRIEDEYGNKRPVYVWDAKSRIWFKVTWELKFSTLRSGIYKGTYKFAR